MDRVTMAAPQASTCRIDKGLGGEFETAADDITETLTKISEI